MIEAIRHPRVVAIERERVLRQIVGADRDEIDTRREMVEESDRRGRLDHHAEARPPHGHTFATELPIASLSSATVASTSSTRVTIGTMIRRLSLP